MRCWPIVMVLLLAACTDDRPDVMLITLDTTRGDRISAYAGEGNTPAIDALIRGGVYYPQATTPMPRTTPGVASLMTGLLPYRHGSREVGEPMREDVRTMAERLQAAGYYTVGISANSSAGPLQGLDRGFDLFVTREDLASRFKGQMFDELNPARNGIGWAGAVTRQAIEAMERAPVDQPLFLWLLYFDPHMLYLPPPSANPPAAAHCHKLYDYVRSDLGHHGGLTAAGKAPLGIAALDECISLYDAEINYVDQQLHELFLFRDTKRDFAPRLTILTADHGENLGEHDLYYEHGDNVHHAALRVPIALSGPGIPTALRGNRVISLVDVMPTLMGLLKLPSDPTLDGTNLTDWCMDAPCHGDHGYRFAESANAVFNYNFDRPVTGWSLGRICLNDSPWTRCWQYRNGEVAGSALFNHVVDPELRTDLAADHPETVDRLEVLRQNWPIDSARELTVFDHRYKLTWFPMLDGSYREELYDLTTDSAERIDRSQELPAVFERMTRQLEGIYTVMPPAGKHGASSRIRDDLKGLGYVQP